jgi:hypothetical protein
MVENKLREAIKNKLTVAFRYNDEDTYRIFAPYIIYKSGDNILVSGTQIRDYKEMKAENSPHKFNLAKIRSIRVMNIKFNYDNRFNVNRAEYKHSIYVIHK